MQSLHLLAAVVGLVGAAAGAANAGVVKSSGTMCAVYNPSGFCSASGHLNVKGGTPSGGSGADFGQAWDDKPVATLRPVWPTASRNQLLIFLHGTGGQAASFESIASTGQLGFLDDAATLGYNVIAPDWPDGEVPNGQVCGCYRDCYGDWDWIRWMGGSKDGLRVISSTESISGRVRAIIANRMLVDPAGGWAQFLDANQPGGIAWSKVVVSGHSQGANLTLYLAKHEPLAKAIAFSAFDEELSSLRGTSNSNPTYYHYGSENGIGACTPTAAPDPNNCSQAANSVLVAGYTADNNFNGFGGSTWQTPLRSIYAFNDLFDTAGPWNTIHAGLCTINLDAQNNGSDGFLDVSLVNTNLANWNSLDYHWLTSAFNRSVISQCGNTCMSGSTSIPCNGHSQVIATGECDAGSTGDSKRIAVWKYLLTD